MEKSRLEKDTFEVSESLSRDPTSLEMDSNLELASSNLDWMLSTALREHDFISRLSPSNSDSIVSLITETEAELEIPVTLTLVRATVEELKSNSDLTESEESAIEEFSRDTLLANE